MFTHSRFTWLALALISCIERKLLNIYLEMIYHRNTIEFKLKISSKSISHCFLTNASVDHFPPRNMRCKNKRSFIVNDHLGRMKFMVTLRHSHPPPSPSSEHFYKSAEIANKCLKSSTRDSTFPKEDSFPNMFLTKDNQAPLSDSKRLSLSNC